MQQRLRGAQRRQVKDVDFGLVFPAAAPAAEAPATQTSPQPELPQPEPLPQLSSRRTPAARTRATNTGIPQENVRPPGSHSTIDANTSAKRRKLDTDDTPVSSSRSTRSQPRRDIYAIEDAQPDDSLLDMLLDTTNDSIPKESVPTPAVDQAPVSSTPTTRPRSKTPLLAAQVVDEVTESPRDAPGSGHRIRVSGIDVTASSSRLQSIQDNSTAQTVSETRVRQNKRKRGERGPPSLRMARRSRQSHVVQGESLEPNELSPEQSLRHDRESLELDELSPEQPSRRGRAPIVLAEVEMSEDEPVEEVSIQEPEEAEAIDDEQAAAILKKNKGRRISRGIPIAAPEVGEPRSSPVAKKRRGRQRNDSTPAQQRHPKQAPPKSKPAKTGKTVRIGSPIPVTVLRFTKPLVYDDDEEDADILNSEIPHVKRAGVNTIDVLSDFCGEIVGTALETLEEGASACEDAALRREYKTKWKAVADFGKELQTRLLEHTINLDNGYSLERRLRDEQKKKLRLREDILRIRAEREQVALRMDDVRIRHEKERTKAQSRDNLNNNVHDIEMVIDLSKQRQPDDGDQSNEMVGIEVLLKRVAGEVSSKGDAGGLLMQIKDFNAFLERAALALEGRKV
ncbi:uncharacterized protein PAC_05572 [Phialocephala subalpina]|uniref:Inner kinetochore subunit AME1 domain-containing protein n=1 Tax=Phialocephala subalpina TaxID=576137 RepID=A0A1L7WSD0_9HELO|nr:uncharacterized protein PAC_05572 [Phialocephala subalpina]